MAGRGPEPGPKNALISRYNLAGSAYWRKGLEEPEVWAAMENGGEDCFLIA